MCFFEIGVHSSSTMNTKDLKFGQSQIIIVHNVDKHVELENNKRRYISKQCLYYFSLTGILVCSLLVVSMLAFAVVKYSNSIPGQNSSDIITDTAGPLRIILRKEWMALPPTDKLEPLELPVSRVIIAHTATTNCTTQADCSVLMRSMQAHHIEMKYDDIGYNFLVGGDGAIYVGRGWNDVGAHTLGYNRNSICFAFIGTFETIEPPKRQIDAVQRMIVEGVKLKKLTAKYALYGQRQLQPTLSPGTALYPIIQKWDHWTNVIH